MAGIESQHPSAIFQSVEAYRDQSAKALHTAEGFIGQAQGAIGEADRERALEYATLAAGAIYRSLEWERSAHRLESGTGPADFTFIAQTIPESNEPEEGQE